jgi:hypothetical protein
MDMQLKESFLSKWEKYFGGAGLPIACFYTDKVSDEDKKNSENIDRCLVCNVANVTGGKAYIYNAKTAGCPGGKRYSGFVKALRPDFEYFLSCGIPGKMEGERYKKSPELVKKYLADNPPFEISGSNLVFKRWDKLTVEDNPEIMTFFAGPDVLSGLYTLANFDYSGTDGVICPMGSGCSSILSYPLVEARSKKPRCVLGMFDVSARPCVPAGTLTFSIPVKRFEVMLGNMDESFLITDSWKQVRERIKGS